METPLANLVPGTAAESDSRRFSYSQARAILGDLFVHNSLIYWTDMFVCLTVGYAAASLYFNAPLWSLQQIVCLLTASFALFRVGSYIHEIVHMRQGELTRFRLAWDICCGIPMLMPSFFYTNHIDHHKSQHYGTDRDGEYLPLSHGPWHVAMMLAQIPVLPIYIAARFMISPLTFITPAVREWFLTHMSSFVLNYKHKLTIPPNAPRRFWAAIELACCLRIWAMFLVIALGVFPPTRIVQMYVLAMCVLGLNYFRNLVAHHYRNDGETMSHLEQLEDSCNIVGNWWSTELFFPLGLRYHALHHLFPSLPYHNLYEAHRRLMAKLPADSPYRGTVFPSVYSVLCELWNDGQKSRQARRQTHEHARPGATKLAARA